MKNLSAAKKILFMRAFGGLAWADGRVDPAERAFLLKMGERLQLDEVQRARLDEMLQTPMAASDAARLLRDLARGVLNARERQVLVAELRALAAADGDFAPEERALIAQIEAGVSSAKALRQLMSTAVTKENAS